MYVRTSTNEHLVNLSNAFIHHISGENIAADQGEFTVYMFANVKILCIRMYVGGHPQVCTHKIKSTLYL